METILLVAKFTLIGIFIFLAATVITKSVGKFVENAKKKEDNDKS